MKGRYGAEGYCIIKIKGKNQTETERERQLKDPPPPYISTLFICLPFPLFHTPVHPNSPLPLPIPSSPLHPFFFLLNSLPLYPLSFPLSTTPPCLPPQLSFHFPILPRFPLLIPPISSHPFLLPLSNPPRVLYLSPILPPPLSSPLPLHNDGSGGGRVNKHGGKSLPSLSRPSARLPGAKTRWT